MGQVYVALSALFPLLLLIKLWPLTWRLADFSDQEPVKRSRTSLDASERPLDSDRGSMDEYGDIDPGRFNEDGSFIGEYGKSTNMDI